MALKFIQDRSAGENIGEALGQALGMGGQYYVQNRKEEADRKKREQFARLLAGQPISGPMEGLNQGQLTTQQKRSQAATLPLSQKEMIDYENMLRDEESTALKEKNRIRKEQESAERFEYQKQRDKEDREFKDQQAKEARAEKAKLAAQKQQAANLEKLFEHQRKDYERVKKQNSPYLTAAAQERKTAEEILGELSEIEQNILSGNLPTGPVGTILSTKIPNWANKDTSDYLTIANKLIAREAQSIGGTVTNAKLKLSEGSKLNLSQPTETKLGVIRRMRGKAKRVLLEDSIINDVIKANNGKEPERSWRDWQRK